MDLFVSKGAYWVPTLTVMDYVAEERAKLGAVSYLQMYQGVQPLFKKALQKGVKIAFGTDAGGFDWQKISAGARVWFLCEIRNGRPCRQSKRQQQSQPSS